MASGSWNAGRTGIGARFLAVAIITYRSTLQPTPSFTQTPWRSIQMEIQVVVELPATPTEVWSYLRDVTKHSEWMMDVSKASSAERGGNMPGRRAASMDFPEPGVPTINR